MKMNEPTFIRRSSILPKKKSEYPLFIFISSMIPITYWFEIWVVLPYFFSNHPITYWSLFIFGHFVLHNIVGNFLGIIMFDTSIKGRKMPSENEPGVQYCSVCKTYTPPRSFHCPSCDICILKRDHHCLFTSCCVGFYNHRFFFLFVFYMLLATAISTPFNIYFLTNVMTLSELSVMCSIVFPVLLLFFNLGNSSFEIQHLYMMISAVSCLGIAFCSVWFIFHMRLILKGTVVHEMRKCINIYNLGEEKNLELVLGKRYYAVWFSPYVKSPLLGDGITYPIKQTEKEE